VGIITSANPCVSVVILNYNGKEFLGECLESLYDQSFADFEIIVVDNNSNDGSVDFIRQNFSEVKLVVNNKNVGFAKGNNIGVTQAKNDLIVLLNNDTVVDKDWLKELVNAVNDQNVAIAMSKIYTEGIPSKYYESNGTLNLLGYNIMNVFDNPTMIFYASGCSLMFKKDMLGLPFDNDYFIYSEDVYLSWRARLNGLKVVHVPRSIVHHRGSGDTKKFARQLRITFLNERNRILNLLIFYSLFFLLKMCPLFILVTLFNFSVSLLGKRYSFLGLLKAYGWLISNVDLILSKRKKIQAQRKAKDEDIVKYMSYKLSNSSKIWGVLLNKIAYLYCKIVNLRTWEFQ